MRDKNLYQIMSGTIYLELKDETLIIRPPTTDVLYFAAVHAQKISDKAFEENVWTKEELDEWMEEMNLWSDELEEKLKIIPSRVEQMKVDYYEAIIHPEKRDLISLAIDKEEKIYEELSKQKYRFFPATVDGLRRQAHNLFVIERTTFFEDGRPYDFVKTPLTHILSLYQKAQLSDKEVRNCAKSAEWRAYWNAHKAQGRLFAESSCELSDQQRQLIAWSNIYESALESMEPPTEEVMKDNHAFDGWLIKKRREREAEKKSEQDVSKNERINSAGELFVGTKTKANPRGASRKHIHDLNSPHAKGIKKQTLEEVRKHGSIDDKDLSRNKLAKQMAANRGAVERAKSR